MDCKSSEPQMIRPASPPLDAIIGKMYRVLDDGFVRVVDYMGTDASIVQAARVSYGAGTKQVRQDRGLIRYLMRHHHTTPFEMCEIKFHVRVPMDCWRQWIRHRTANVNEYSTRYSVAIDSMQRTSSSAWRLQSRENRQGSAEHLDDAAGATLSEREAALHQKAVDVYQERLTAGVAREQARKDLPLSTYTEAYWKTDLHNLLHFLKLRLDEHAQFEIRQYAQVIGNEIVAAWCPVVWEAFNDYERTAVTLSRNEIKIIVALQSEMKEAATKLCEEADLFAYKGEQRLPSREGLEFEKKLGRFGLTAPW